MSLGPGHFGIIRRLLVGRNNRPLQSILRRSAPADLATLMTMLDGREVRQLVAALESVGKSGEVLTALPEGQVARVLGLLERHQIAKVIQKIRVDEAAYLLGLWDEKESESVINLLPQDLAARLHQYLAYPAYSAGRIMSTHVFSLPSHLTAQEGLDRLREKAQEESIYYIYCVNEADQLARVISLRELATSPPGQSLSSLGKADVVAVHPEDSSEKVARLVAHYDFIALPVIDQDRRLLGIVTVDDVVDIIQNQVTADLYARAGLQSDDRVFTSPSMSIRNRLPWMLLNLFMAFMASLVLSGFEDLLQSYVLLSLIKNVVAGMGGNAAIQSLTVVTRGLATGDFQFIGYGRAVQKELVVGLVIGLITGLASTLFVFLWKADWAVGLIMGLAMAINSFIAAAAGTLVPLALARAKQDPATGSGVLVTTITDIFGFFVFLEMARFGLPWLRQVL